MQPSDVKYGMVARAHSALYATSSHEIDATDDEIRAAISAALTAMPDDLLRKLVAERGCVLVPESMLWDLLDALEDVRAARSRSEEDWNALNAADVKLRGLLDKDES